MSHPKLGLNLRFRHHGFPESDAPNRVYCRRSRWRRLHPRDRDGQGSHFRFPDRKLSGQESSDEGSFPGISLYSLLSCFYAQSLIFKSESEI